MNSGPASVVTDSITARRRLRALGVAAAFLASTCAAPAATSSADPAPDRQRQLVRLVRQDCGACHGLLLTGGLGPALTRRALRAWSADAIAATILQGRPGTPMPPWRSLLSQTEAAWIARRLLEGFPQEPGGRP